MAKYEIVEEQFNTPETGSYISFGICAYNETSNEVISKVSDVFDSKERAANLVRICNEYELDPVHLRCIVENELLSS